MSYDKIIIIRNVVTKILNSNSWDPIHKFYILHEPAIESAQEGKYEIWFLPVVHVE